MTRREAPHSQYSPREVGAMIATENTCIEDGVLISRTTKDTKLHEAVIPVSFVRLCVLRG